MDSNAEKGKETGPSPFARGVLLLATISSIALFSFLGKDALNGSEDRWAEIVREMSLTRDYIHPLLNWNTYFDKPILTYWFIVPFASWLGDGELAARIPSAIAGLLAILATVAFTKLALKNDDENLFDDKDAERISLLAGYMLLGSYGFMHCSRQASADAANMAAGVMAVGVFVWSENKTSFWRYLLFSLIVFGGILAKGLPVLVLSGAMLLPYVIFTKNWKRHLNWKAFLAVILGIAAFAAPLVWDAVTELPQGCVKTEAMSAYELLWRENITRAISPFDHKDPFYSYIYNLPARTLLPWTLPAVAAVIAAVAAFRKQSRRRKGLLSGMLLTFVAFSMSGSRRWYYILGLAPFCAVLISVVCARARKPVDETGGACVKITRLAVTVTRIAITAVAAFAFSSIIAWCFWPLCKHEPWISIDIPGGLFCAATLLGLIALVILAYDELVCRILHVPEGIGSTVLAGVVMFSGFFAFMQPQMNRWRTEKPFISRFSNANRDIPSDSIAFYGCEVNRKFLFYTNATGHIEEINKRKENQSLLRKFVENHRGSKIAIVTYVDVKSIKSGRHDTWRENEIRDVLSGFGLDFDHGCVRLEEEVGKYEKSGKKLVAIIAEIPQRH